MSGSKVAIDTQLEASKRKQEIVCAIGDSGINVGEMSVEETSILVNPDERIIHQVSVSDAKKADKLFDDLMGSEVSPRKDFIKEHAEEATYVL